MPAFMNGFKHYPTAFSCYLPNEASNESSGSGSVLLVIPVRRSDDDSIVADVVALVADDLDLGGGDQTESLVTVCVAKGNDYSRSADVLEGNKVPRSWHSTLVK
jgi:hypothetical protein